GSSDLGGGTAERGSHAARSAPKRRGSGSSGRIPCGTTRGSRHPEPPRAFRTGGRFRPRPPPPGTPGRRPSAPSRIMPGMTAPQHHALNYVEITVTDLEEAKRFYTEAFGWRFNDYGPGYAGIQGPDGDEVGGLARGEEVRGGGPFVLLFSE